VLGKRYGERTVRDAFVEGIVTRWASDPFSLGSYSHLAVHGTPRDREELARSVGDLHFAGEATNRAWPVTVHGAFDSGRREAKKIRVKLKSRK